MIPVLVLNGRSPRGCCAVQRCHFEWLAMQVGRWTRSMFARKGRMAAIAPSILMLLFLHLFRTILSFARRYVGFSVVLSPMLLLNGSLLGCRPPGACTVGLRWPAGRRKHRRGSWRIYMFPVAILTLDSWITPCMLLALLLKRIFENFAADFPVIFGLPCNPCLGRFRNSSQSFADLCF